MWEDPIVEEIHRTREKLAAEYDFDVKAIFADLRKRQIALGGRLVPQKRRADSMADVDRSHHFDTPEGTPTEAAPTREFGH